MGIGALIVEAVSPSRTAALVALFGRASSPCFCQYWTFLGTKNEWLERCAFRPEENEALLGRAIAAGEETGLVAVLGEDVVGWMKVTPRARLPKLRRLPVYRHLDLGDEHTTFSIACVLVDPAHRRAGVARALVSAAPALARAWGAKALEAYPRRSTEPLHDEEAWQGPESVFASLGFVPVHDVAPYPVYRNVL